MVIDLEQPSVVYPKDKEDSRPNVSLNMDDPGGELLGRDGETVGFYRAVQDNREYAGQNLCGSTSNSKDKEHTENGVASNSHKRNLEPQDGMEFESKEDAFLFYKEYAKSIGFATIIKASRRSRISGKFIDAKFVCTRYGNKRESRTSETTEPVPSADCTESIAVKRKRGRINRSWSKTDCKACMHVKRRQDERWIVRSFIKEHNHEIYPDQAYYFRGHRKIDLDNNNVDALHAIRARTRKEKYEEEARADFETWHKQPGLKSPSPFGKQMAKMYTHAVFKKFQVEVLGVVACHPRKENDDGTTMTFKVQDFEENQNFSLVWNQRTSVISCSCRLFEYIGFLCRHVLIVLQMCGVHNIPSQYILKRWTKDAKSRQTTGQADAVDSRIKRYNDLCRRAFKLNDEASLSQKSYNVAFNALEEALRKCENANSTVQSALESSSPSIRCLNGFEEVTLGNSTSKTNKKTSVPRKGKGQSNLRASTVGCSYRSQGSIQGVGQLNNMAPTRDDYYGNQQNMQGLGQLPFRPQTVQSCFNIQDSLQDMVLLSLLGTSDLCL
ncbi:hypothetical protein RJ639_022426 [Escallonia herrerae]|uniref:Protein FAR1-RELATED SEQUENCE n=1 Tax=Escallonia herrerae TaxID=1293975 RepID=A0AA88V340_9ASTE|nr:hypothetical protein RJ639_022426 [Escallonia herrerae]